MVAIGDEVVDLLETAEAHECLEFVHLGVRANVVAGDLGFDGEVTEGEEFVLDRVGSVCPRITRITRNRLAAGVWDKWDN